MALATVRTPTVSTPTVSTPTVSTPTVSTPTVSTPTVSTPTVSTPTVSTPTVSTRSAKYRPNYDAAISLSRSGDARFAFAIVLLVLLLQPALAQRIESPQVGLDQICKVGCWTRIKFEIRGGDESKSVRIDLHAPDSDGAIVHYIGPKTELIGPGETYHHERYVKLGRLDGTIEIRLIDEDENLVHESSVDLPFVALSTQPWFVEVFGEVGMERLARRRKYVDELRPLVGAIAAASRLPSHVRGWDGVERVFLSTHGDGWRDVTSAQWSALETWIRLGGQCILCVGKNGEVVSQHEVLSKWLPGVFDRVETVNRNPLLEDYASSNTQLLDVVATRLTKLTGSSAVNFGKRGRSLGPAIVSHAYGFGKIYFCALDLADEPVASWDARERFVEQMLDLQHADFMSKEKGNRNSQNGYTEMSGQLRAALDTYDGGSEDGAGVTVLAFSLVAFGLVIYLLVIGPLDYFFLNRVIGRMEWTWFTFPLGLVVACGMIIGIHSWRLGDEPMRLNQVDVVDLDLSHGTVRGTSWVSLFTAQPNLFDVSANTHPAFPDCQIDEQAVIWQGLSGKGLGGFQSVSSVGWADSQYSVSTESNGDLSIHGMPIGAASSRSLLSQWRGSVDVVGKQSALSEDSLLVLSGTVTNPLDVTLKNPTLVYRSTIYRLGRQIRPDQQISVRDLPRRGLEWDLTRRITSGDKQQNASTTTKWNPLEQDVRRIIEVMMLHKAAGGADYTQLTQRYQSQIDLSDQLNLGRAILWGEADEPAQSMKVGEHDATSNAERHWAFYRILIPVASGTPARE
jgi:hypothetical protein